MSTGLYPTWGGLVLVLSNTISPSASTMWSFWNSGYLAPKAKSSTRFAGRQSLSTMIFRMSFVRILRSNENMTIVSSALARVVSEIVRGIRGLTSTYVPRSIYSCELSVRSTATENSFVRTSGPDSLIGFVIAFSWASFINRSPSLWGAQPMVRPRIMTMRNDRRGSSDMVSPCRAHWLLVSAHAVTSCQ